MDRDLCSNVMGKQSCHMFMQLLMDLTNKANRDITFVAVVQFTG